MAKSISGINKDKVRNTFTVHKQYKGITIKKRGFETLNEARAYLSNEMYLIDHPEKKDERKDITLNELFSIYIAFRSMNIRITTLEGNKYKYRVHIKPFFGDDNISRLNPDKVREWKQNLVNLRYSNDMTNQVIMVFRNLLKFGLDRDYHVNKKVLLELDKVKTNVLTKERDILTYDEIDKFLNTFEKEIPSEYDYWLYFYAYSRSGMRPNEFRGLQVKDLKRDRISVNHDITSKIKGMGVIMQPCKNENSIREVVMPPDIMSLLYEHTSGYDPNDFIFGKDKPFSESNIRRELDAHLQKAKLPHMTIYGFRHSHATHLIRSGVMIKVVSMRLGHKDIQTTLNTYQHLLNADQESVLKYL